MDTSDPDLLAQLYVTQWMHENGLHDALRALEKQLGKLYDDTQLPEASQLMQLVWRHVEERLQQDVEDEEEGATGAGGASSCSRATRRSRHEESLRLLRAGGDDYAGRAVVGEVAPEVHRSNIIAVRLVPGQNQVITGTGDGVVRCVGVARDDDDAAGASGSDAAGVLWESRVGSAAVLSLALHPAYRSGLPLVAVGSMDGRVAVLHGPSGAVLATAQPHTKYVVRVAWAPGGATAATPAPEPDGEPAGGLSGGCQDGQPGPEEAAACGSAAAAGTPASGTAPDSGGGSDGNGGARGRAAGLQCRAVLASASTDETVVVQRLDLDLVSDVDLGDSCHSAPPASCGKLTTVKQVPYGATLTDVAFLRDGRTLVVAVRGSNYLRLLDTHELMRQAAAGAAGAAIPERLVNMNESGDDHISFTAKYLTASPCGNYLAVCTDTPRLLVLRTSDWSLLRLVFGLPVDQFPQPVAAWHRDSNYIYVSGAGAQLCVFHLGSGRLVHSARHHKINIRDLDYDPGRNLLASCSFDKTVKLVGPGAAAASKTASATVEVREPGPHVAGATTAVTEVLMPDV